MRFASVIAACALIAGMASASIGPASAQSANGWSYDYTGGEAVATQRDSSGEVTAMISCRPPTGELVISAFDLRSAGRKHATVQIGDFRTEADGRVDRASNGERAFQVRLEQGDPVIAGGRGGEITITAGGRSQTFLRGSGRKIGDVAIACWSAA
jgi:hypothetical protein